MFVCPRCFCESAALKERFNLANNQETCPTCGSEGVRILEASELADLFEGIEAHYEPLCGDPYRLGKYGISGIGPGMGEDSLVEILRQDWDLFSDLISDDNAEDILGCVWPNYSGEYTRRPSRRWQAVQSEWDEVKQLLCKSGQSLDACKEANDALHRLLYPWLESLGSRLKCQTWRRSQIQDSRDCVFEIPRMEAPPPDKAIAGRANPQGISFLYVSSDEATAVAEVRAEPGDWVTVARVEFQQKGMWVLDLTRDVRIIDPFAHADIDEALMVREFLQNFAVELSRPVRTRDKVSEYISTQAISMYFRDNDYSGIVFKSSLSKGNSAVFFDSVVPTITNPIQRAVWSKALDVVDNREFDRRIRQLRGLPY